MNQVTPTDLPSQNPSASSGGTGANTLVTLVRDPLALQDGLITVAVPREVSGAGMGFRFPLPTPVAEQTGPDAPLQITTLNGQAMPAWLRYQPETHSFVASALPLGALPLQLLVRIGNKHWIVFIEEGKI